MYQCTDSCPYVFLPHHLTRQAGKSVGVCVYLSVIGTCADLGAAKHRGLSALLFVPRFSMFPWEVRPV